MKKLFTAVVLILLFAFPLGSSQKSLHNETNIWTYKSYESVMEDRQKQLTCLAKNIYFEARNEPFAGQFAVALVTLNRVMMLHFQIQYVMLYIKEYIPLMDFQSGIDANSVGIVMVLQMKYET